MSAEADPSDLFSQLETLEHAQPLDPEDDLVLRMQAVSKVRAARKGTRKAKSPALASPKGISKRPRRSAAKKEATPDDSRRRDGASATAMQS